MQYGMVGVYWYAEVVLYANGVILRQTYKGFQGRAFGSGVNDYGLCGAG